MSIIAISRGTHSGGEALARALAERLEYRCVSREVLLQAARDYGVPLEELRAAMENRPSFWERLAGMRRTHLVFVQAALCEQAESGNLVYHGHVGHLLLPGVTHLVRVRVVAGTEFRLAAIMRERGLARREAELYLDRVDRDRREWTRFLFGVDWDDPHLYDLLLNLDRMSLEAACDVVMGLVGREEFQPTPASRRAMADLVLASRVRAVLASTPSTRDADLQVAAEDGSVTITGATAFSAVPEAVRWVAQTVEGVTEIRAEIEILPLTYHSML